MNKNTDIVDTNTTAADAALAVWLEMWNSDSGIARRICSEGFRIHFLNSERDGSNPGDDVLGAESFAEFLDRYHEQHPDVAFTEVCGLWMARTGGCCGTCRTGRLLRAGSMSSTSPMMD